MKLNITKEWFRKGVHLEEGLEIGAGSLHTITNDLGPGPDRPCKMNAVLPAVNFGQTIALLRRKQRWTLDKLAEEADSTTEELHSIESDPDYTPELSTVCSIAKVFKLPAKALIQQAGLAETASSRLREDNVRYAACSSFTEPLSEEEEIVLQAVLHVILETTP